MQSESRWKIDKHIPVALMVTLLISFIGQTFALGWYVARQDSRISFTEKEVQTLKKEGELRDAVATDIVRQLTNIDKQVAIIAERLNLLSKEKERAK